jgi:hypothetical protein
MVRIPQAACEHCLRKPPGALLLPLPWFRSPVRAQSLTGQLSGDWRVLSRRFAPPTRCTGAGTAPSLAVLLLERLRLFPVVFAAPPQNTQQLGEGFGAPCASAIAAAEALLKASGLAEEVGPLAGCDRILLLATQQACRPLGELVVWLAVWLAGCLVGWQLCDACSDVVWGAAKGRVRCCVSALRYAAGSAPVHTRCQLETQAFRPCCSLPQTIHRNSCPLRSAACCCWPAACSRFAARPSQTLPRAAAARRSLSAPT